MKRLIFMIFMILFIEAEDNIPSIYKVEGYNSVPSTKQSLEHNLSTKEVKLFEFQKDYDKALIEAKRDSKYIFLLITEEYCQWCEKLMDIVLQDDAITSKLRRDYISVIVDRNKGFYPSNIGITGVPSVFIINPKTGEIVVSVVGYHKKEHYLKWFKYVDNIEN